MDVLEDLQKKMNKNKTTMIASAIITFATFATMLTLGTSIIIGAKYVLAGFLLTGIITYVCSSNMYEYCRDKIIKMKKTGYGTDEEEYF